MAGSKRLCGKEHGKRGKGTQSFKRKYNKQAPEGFLKAMRKVSKEIEGDNKNKKPPKHKNRKKPQYNPRPTKEKPYQVGRSHKDPHETNIGIQTYISYVFNNKLPEVIIFPNPCQNRKIYSGKVAISDGRIEYSVKQFHEKGERRKPIETSSIFKYLYQTPWITEEKQAEKELRAIEETIRAKRNNIESHLRTELNLC